MADKPKSVAEALAEVQFKVNEAQRMRAAQMAEQFVQEGMVDGAIKLGRAAVKGVKNVGANFGKGVSTGVNNPGGVTTALKGIQGGSSTKIGMADAWKKGQTIQQGSAKAGEFVGANPGKAIAGAAVLGAGATGLAMNAGGAAPTADAAGNPPQPTRRPATADQGGQGGVASRRQAAAPAAAPAPEPVDPHAKSKAMFQAHSDATMRGDDNPAAFFAADRQRQAELAAQSAAPAPAARPAPSAAAPRPAPLPPRRPAEVAPEEPAPDQQPKAPGVGGGDVNPNAYTFGAEEESGGKTKGKKKMSESVYHNAALMAAAIDLINKENMFESAKKMKGKCSSCGKMPCKCESMEEDTSSDPDMAAPRAAGSPANKNEIKFKKGPDSDSNGPAVTEDPPPTPPKRPAGLKEAYSEKQKKMAALAGNKDKIDAADLKALRKGKKMEEDIAFSDAEIAHINEVLARGKIGDNDTGSVVDGVPTNAVIDEARGRPKGSTKAAGKKAGTDEYERDPRAHAEVVLGQIAAGGNHHLPHDNGEVTKPGPGESRKVLHKLYAMKPAERQAAVQQIHGSAKGFRDMAD